MALRAVGKRYTGAVHMGGGEVLPAYPPSRRVPEGWRVEAPEAHASMAAHELSAAGWVPHLLRQGTG